MFAVRVGGHRRGSPRSSYNAGSAGLVDGAGYPARSWGVVLEPGYRVNLMIRPQIQEVCTLDRVNLFI
jgi:hypothetical protein